MCGYINQQNRKTQDFYFVCVLYCFIFCVKIFLISAIVFLYCCSGISYGKISAADSSNILSNLLTESLITSSTEMFLYGSMCGMSTSAFRAVCMFTLRLLAPVLGRTYDILTGLALAEIMLLIDQPLYLYNSGFLFSFGAILGVVVIAPRLQLTLITSILVRTGLLPNTNKYSQEKFIMKFADEETRPSQKIWEKLVDAIRSGLGIALMTLPVYSCFYYTYPIHSLVLNLFVIPIMSVLMVAGLITMVVGVLLLVAGAGNCYFIGSVVHILLYIYKTLCSSTFLTHNLTLYMGHSDKWQALLYYVLIAGFMMLSSKNDIFHNVIREKRIIRIYRKIPGFKSNVGYTKLLLIAFAFFILTFHPRSNLTIDMIDVGQGDGIVISSAGKNILIDCGSTSKKNVGKYQIIPFLKYKAIGELDAIVLTHEDEDHLSGIMDILDDMEKGGILVKELVLPEVNNSCRGDNYHKLEDRAKELKIPILYINEGEKFSVGKAVFICINPAPNMKVEGANAYSTVLFMKYEGLTALFTGDVEEEGQENIKHVINQSPELFRNLTILKVAHHGSKYTTDEEFLEMLSPKLALISCGKDNSYGHPHDEVLTRLENIGARVYRTDLSGEITINYGNSGRIRVKEYLIE